MGGPFALAVAWGMFCADHAQWSLLGRGALMIEHRDSGGCLGLVGINHGPLFPERKLGWLVHPEAEGHGFAFEAATALRDWRGLTGRALIFESASRRKVETVARGLGARGT